MNTLNFIKLGLELEKDYPREIKPQESTSKPTFNIPTPETNPESIFYAKILHPIDPEFVKITERNTIKRPPCKSGLTSTTLGTKNIPRKKCY